jgi:hypothetical protein
MFLGNLDDQAESDNHLVAALSKSAEIPRILSFPLPIVLMVLIISVGRIYSVSVGFHRM